MDIWLDTTHIRTIQKAVRLGLLSGVTTNPALIAEAQEDLEKVLKDLLHHQEGPVTAQVVAQEVDEMVQQGQCLFALSNRIIVKVPVTENGIEAIQLLSRQGIPTMATVLFTPQQALIAATAGANYVAPYLSRLEKGGGNPWAMLESTKRIFDHYRFKTKILGASISNVDQVIRCAEIGIYGVTLKEEIFNQLLGEHPLTQQGVRQFAEVSQQSALFSL